MYWQVAAVERRTLIVYVCVSIVYLKWPLAPSHSGSKQSLHWLQWPVDWNSSFHPLYACRQYVDVGSLALPPSGLPTAPAVHGKTSLRVCACCLTCTWTLMLVLASWLARYFTIPIIYFLGWHRNTVHCNLCYNYISIISLICLLYVVSFHVDSESVVCWL